MLDQRLLPSESDLSGLEPKRTNLACGTPLYLFHSRTVDILKLDIVFDAGSGVQPKPLCAGMARDMLLDASPNYPAEQVAETLDRLGVVVDRYSSVSSTKVSVYALKRHVARLYPLLGDLLREPLFGSNEYDILIAKRRQTLLTDQLKTAAVARNLFYQSLYGLDHPYGRFAVPGDEQRLSIEDVRSFAHRWYRLGNVSLVLSGNYDDETLKLLDSCFATPPITNPQFPFAKSQSLVPNSRLQIRKSIESSVQTTLRIGRTVPIAWDDPDYPVFLILSTILGGYFGSRLMSNIREKKGYTYGINTVNNIMRGSSLFCIVTDVANTVVDQACAEIYNEIGVLRSEPVPIDELSLVCNYMAGDFLRSVDGIFERSERFCNMMDTNIDEQFTCNFLDALRTVTPEKLTAVASRLLNPADLTEVIVGA